MNDEYKIPQMDNRSRENDSLEDDSPKKGKRPAGWLLKTINILFFIAVIIGAYFAYKYFDENFISQNPYEEEQQQQDETTDESNDSADDSATNEDSQDNNDHTEVETMQISNEPLKRINFQKIGTVKPYKSSTITAETAGNITNFDTDEGDIVKKGEELAQLSDSVATQVADINYKNAETLLAYARESLNSVSNSVDQGIKSAKLGVETAELNYQNALLTYQNLEQTLGEQVKASMIGVQSAEIGLQSAQENYYNTITTNSVSLDNTIDSAMSGVVSALTITDTSLDSVSSLFEAPFIDPIDNYVSSSKVNNLEDDLDDLRNEYEDLFDDYEDIRNDYDADKTARLLENTVDLLEDLQSSLYETKDVLNEVIDEQDEADVTPILDSLIAIKTTTNTFLSSIDQSKSGLNQGKSALDGALLSSELQPGSAFNGVEAAEAQLTSAREGVLQTQAAKKSQLDGSNHAINMAQKQLESSIAALNSAKANGTSQEVGAETQVAQLKGQLDILAANLEGRDIKAPLNGTLLEKFIENGNYINPGQRIATVADMSKVKVQISLTAEELNYIKLGQEVVIKSPLGDDTTGKVTKILPTINAASKKIDVEVIIPNEDMTLLANMFVDVAFPEAQKASPGIYIPFKAVVFEKNTPHVFMIQNGKAVKIEIEVSSPSGNMIEVVSGLSKDDVIIIEGAKLVVDGQHVKVTN